MGLGMILVVVTEVELLGWQQYSWYQHSSCTSSQTNATTYQATGGSFSSTTDDEIKEVLNRLLAIDTRYYVYNHSRFKPLSYRPSVDNDVVRDRYKEFAQVELDLIAALEEHPLRTIDQSEASLFVIPLSLANRIIEHEETVPVGQVFRKALYKQEAFQQQKPHLLLVQMPNMFYQELLRMFSKKAFRISQQLFKLWNNTVIGKVFDQDACQETLTANALATDQSDFLRITQSGFLPVLRSASKRLSRSGFSLGQLAPNHFPFVPASYDKFRNATIDIFYHSRLTPSLFQSTPYRHALLNESIYVKFPNSSIGTDIPAQQWSRDFQDARFCMVIRGDTPTSRALLRAIKVGCIPVVVSDLYPVFATTLKSSIPLHKYAILVDEATFLRDPVAALSQSLNDNLSEDTVRSKIQWLQLAQRIMIPNHPASLFVPALLYETRKAQEYGAQFPEQLLL